MGECARAWRRDSYNLPSGLGTCPPNSELVQFIKNGYQLGDPLRAQLRGGSMLIFPVGQRRNRAYTQACEPAEYCCLHSGISPSPKCWHELRCSPVLSIWPAKPLKQPNVCVPHLSIERWSGGGQVTEPPAVVLLEGGRGLTPGQWQVGGAAVWPLNGMFMSPHKAQPPASYQLSSRE